MRFVADRPFAVPVTTRGDTLRLLLDTGGGANILYTHAVQRLGIATDWVREGTDSAQFAEWRVVERADRVLTCR